VRWPASGNNSTENDRPAKIDRKQDDQNGAKIDAKKTDS
jgi:hypothetical protein